MSNFFGFRGNNSSSIALFFVICLLSKFKKTGLFSVITNSPHSTPFVEILILSALWLSDTKATKSSRNVTEAYFLT